MAIKSPLDFAIRAMALGFSLYCAAAGAQTMYVTDQVVITLRTGESTQNAVIANLRTGDAVEVLDRNAESGYSHVRVVGSNDEGWVLTRYLIPDPTAQQSLSVLEGDHDTARARIADLEAKLAEQQAILLDTEATLTQVQGSNSDITSELADIRSASANAIGLRDQNESLRRRNGDLSSELEVLSMQNAALASRSRQNWFVVGAIVLVAGIVVGLIAPSLLRRRRSEW